MEFKRYYLEIIVTVAVYFFLLFVATNVNVTLGQTYLHFALGILALLIINALIFNKNVQITIAKEKGGWLKAIVQGAVGWLSLIIISTFVMKFVAPTEATFGSVIRLLGAATPALAASKVANLLTFGFAVGYVETQLWARAMEFISDFLHIRLEKQNLWMFKIIFLIILFGIAFMIFHLTAKGITNAPALWIVFIMMVISLSMVVYYGETRQALILHIIANITAAYLTLFM